MLHIKKSTYPTFSYTICNWLVIANYHNHSHQWYPISAISLLFLISFLIQLPLPNSLALFSAVHDFRVPNGLPTSYRCYGIFHKIAKILEQPDDLYVCIIQSKGKNLRFILLLVLWKPLDGKSLHQISRHFSNRGWCTNINTTVCVNN